MNLFQIKYESDGSKEFSYFECDFRAPCNHEDRAVADIKKWLKENNCEKVAVTFSEKEPQAAVGTYYDYTLYYKELR